MTDTDDRQTVIWAWLENLYPHSRPEHGWLTICHSVRSGIATEWFAAGDWDDASDHAANLDTNVWFGVGLRRERLGPRQRGGNADVACLPGLWVDIDTTDGAHAATGPRPANLDEAHQLLGTFPATPTAIISTGGGLHAYWLHPAPIPVDLELLDAWAAWWHTTAEQRGWKVDSVFDPARIMRLPATLNLKYTPPRAVDLLEVHPGRRYSAGELAAHLELDEPAPPAVAASSVVRIVGPAEPAEKIPGDIPAPERPGDRYDREGNCADLLAAAGWTLHHTTPDGEAHWTRPGPPPKGTTGATIYPDGHVAIWTTNAPPLEPRTYTPFGLYTALHHRGDHAAAAAELARQYRGEDRRRHERRHDHDQAATGDSEGEGATDRARPAVIVNGRPLRDITTDILHHLEDANQADPVVFIRGGLLTRIRLDEHDRPIIEALGESSLRGRVARTVDTIRANKDGAKSHVPPPLDVIRDISTLPDWPFPALEAVTEIPTLRPDGTIHHRPGYDPHTRLYHHPTITVPPIPDQPTPAELDAARDLIVTELLGDFPFAGPADRANTIAALLTPLIRPAITGPSPLALLDAPEPGTGKSLLVTVLATLVTGRPAAMSNLPDNDEELRKTITSTLLDGSTIIVFDNIDTTLRSSALAQALTSDTWKDRLLGRNTTVELPNRAAWFATGNNVQVAGDLARRCYHIRLDAKQARPYLRSGFRHPDLIAWTLEHRGELLAALLTLARAWWANDQPAPAATPVLGGYQPWASTIAGILDHAGIGGYLANYGTFVAGADAESDEWEAFLVAWNDRYGTDVVTVGNLMAELESVGTVPLRDALPGDLAVDLGRSGLRKKLGRALKRRAGRHYGDDGWHLIDCGTDRQKKVKTWRVADADYVPTNLLALTTAGDDEKPADRDPVTRDDATGAGFAGFSPPTPYEVDARDREHTHRNHVESGGEETRETRKPATGYVEEI